MNGDEKWETPGNPFTDPPTNRIGEPRINQIANASDVRPDCKVLREIGRKPGSIIDQEISRRVCALAWQRLRAFLVASLYPTNGKRHTSWKCKLTALPPFYRVPFVIFLFVPRNTRSVSIRTFQGEGLKKKI